MAKMYRRNDWNEKEKFSLKKIAQDVLNCNTYQISCVKTSCCIDTTHIAAGPCGSDIRTSCCIDTTKE
jgi:hypothetical protein